MVCTRVAPDAPRAFQHLPAASIAPQLTPLPASGARALTLARGLRYALPRMNPEAALAWAQAERERAAVAKLGADLAPVGVEVLVFKGIHLAFAVAPTPAFRMCRDADVLVLGDFGRAVARLRALSDWQVVDGNWSSHGLRLLATGAYVDLHRLALPPRFGRLDLAGMRARARTRPELFGPVLLPDVLDAAVLAIANHAKDTLGPGGGEKLAQDMHLLVTAGVSAEPLADRLASHGLRRVGALAFADLTRTDPAWVAFRDACAPSRSERALLDAAARGIAEAGSVSERLGFLMVRAVADRPGDGLASFGLAAARLTRDILFR